MLRSLASAMLITSTCLGQNSESSPQGDTAAVVNGTVISNREVEAAFRRSSVAQRPLEEAERKLYHAHMLSMLIDSTLVQQHLDSLKVPVNVHKVREHIEMMKQKLAAKGETLEQFLGRAGIDNATMHKEIGEIYRWMNYVESQSNEQVLRAYFTANKDAFNDTQVRVSHILKKVTPSASAAEREAARKAIDSIRAQLAGGTAFASAVKLHSDCPSKEVDGDLGYFPRKGVMSEPFAAAAFELKVGQISQVVETEFGYHLMVATDRRPGRPVTFEEVADDVKNAYSDELQAALLARLRKSADIQYVR